MNEDRKTDLLNQILADLSKMNIGPAQAMPVRTVWLRASKRGGITVEDLDAVLTWATEIDVMTFTPGGIAGLGSIALTDQGYALACQT